MDLSAEEMLRLIDEAFERRATVTSYEVRSLARLRALGADGERGVRYLREGVYDKQGLKRALVEAVVDALGRRDAVMSLGGNTFRRVGAK